MLWDSVTRPTVSRARVWERSNSLQALEKCGPKAVGLYQYWNARRGNRPMPSRRDIDPCEMRQWLPRLTLVDVAPDGELTYRLVGTQMVELLGKNPTGCSVESAWPEQLAPQVAGSFHNVAENGCPVFCQQFNGWRDDEELTAWSMRLPLSSDGVKVDMVIGCLSGNIGMLSQI